MNLIQNPIPRITNWANPIIGKRKETKTRKKEMAKSTIRQRPLKK